MISRLKIDTFGKFKDRVFEFAPVTLFYGENEAGKTTVFDALFDGLCGPKANTEPGKRLRLRYGIGRKASLEFDGDELSLPAADFLNLFAVRSGSIDLEIEKNSEWMNRVKSELFSGGVDPQGVAKKLDDECRSKAKGTLRAEADLVRGELKDLKSRLDAALADRLACLSEEKLVEEKEARHGTARKEIEGLKKEIESLEREIEQQNLLREGKTLEALLAKLTEKARLSAEIERYSRFSREGLEDLKKRDLRAANLSAEAERARAAHEAAENDRRRLHEEKARAEEDKNLLEKRKVLAEVLKRSLADRDRLVRRAAVITWRPLALAAGLVFFILGGVSFFILPKDVSLLGLAAGTAAAVVFGVFAVRREMKEDTGGLDEAMRAARETWLKETGSVLDAGGYEALLVALDRAGEKAGSAVERWERCRAAAASADADAAAREGDYRKAAAVRDDALRETRGILDSAGAADTVDYAARQEKRRALEERIEEIDLALEEALEKYGVSTEAELESRVTRKLTEISGRVTESTARDQDLRARENLLREKRKTFEVLRAEEQGALGDFSRNLGAVRERFKGLPERISGLEKSIAGKEERLKDLETRLRATEIARDIFQSLAGDAGDMLVNLSREIGETFSRFVGRESRISFETLSVDAAGVADSEGDLRPETVLSSGTRDAFLLAARLVLARKSVPEGRAAVVVLDEPFMTLDRRRTGNVIVVLKEFQESSDWQLVLFTKDEELKRMMVEAFGPGTAVHRLSGKAG
jgi:DNA sulfur modification protein DndD